jgi:hypothetical protein
MDTPGTLSDKEVFHHAVSLLSAISEGPLNGILLTVKNENRTSKVQNQIMA